MSMCCTASDTAGWSVVTAGVAVWEAACAARVEAVGVVDPLVGDCVCSKGGRGVAALLVGVPCRALSAWARARARADACERADPEAEARAAAGRAEMRGGRGEALVEGLGRRRNRRLDGETGMPGLDGGRGWLLALVGPRPVAADVDSIVVDDVDGIVVEDARGEVGGEGRVIEIAGGSSGVSVASAVGSTDMGSEGGSTATATSGGVSCTTSTAAAAASDSASFLLRLLGMASLD